MQYLRKETPLKVKFYYQTNIIQPIETFSEAWKWHQFDSGLICTHYYLVTRHVLPNFLIAVSQSFFNILSSVINTTRQNCRSWTFEKSGIQALIKAFSGSQRGLQFHNIRWWPCIWKIFLLMGGLNQTFGKQVEVFVEKHSLST